MNRTSVVSSVFTAVGYDPGTLTLEVEFTHGRVYQYFDVPEAVYLELMNAASLGEYFNQNIKDRYRYAH